MATIYVIWSRKERCIVPDPYANFTSSQAATDFSRRIIKVTGDQKDQQAKTYDIVAMTV